MTRFKRLPISNVSLCIPLIVLAILAGGCGSTGRRIDDLEKKFEMMQPRVDSLWNCGKELNWRLGATEDTLRQLRTKFQGFRHGIASYAVPDHMDFAGFDIQINTPDAKRRLDEAIMYLINNEARLQQIHGRAYPIYPRVDEILRQEGMSEDCKFVAVVESGLSMRALSRDSASGMWQFIEETGFRYGLVRTSTVDERRNFEKSTRSAARYLRDLTAKFGDILLALAAYNCGEGCISRAIEFQGVKDYFQLWLPQETEDYVPRVLAAKLIFDDPGKYGVVLETRPYWERVEKDTVTVRVTNSLPAVLVAKWTGMTYRDVRIYNPDLIAVAWGPGTQTINIAKGTKKQFLVGLASLKGPQGKKKK